jgi:predicted nucleotidyltransferase
MEGSSSPTPFPEVNHALAEFETRMWAILGRQFLGMYLYGSLAIEDFDPRSSDIDLQF